MTQTQVERVLHAVANGAATSRDVSSATGIPLSLCSAHLSVLAGRGRLRLVLARGNGNRANVYAAIGANTLDPSAKSKFGFPTRTPPSDSTLTRFAHPVPHGIRGDAALPADHPAVLKARTLFPTTVVSADDAPRVLVSGHNSPKIGAKVRKGRWRGFPIFTLTLEERATCPPDCWLFRECYGNAMPMARRHAHGPDLVMRLAEELADKQREHPGGFVVRVHVLGDFYNEDYARQWIDWLDRFPALRIFGYTAHSRDSAIGAMFVQANQSRSDRCAIRFSDAPDELAPARPMSVTTIWRKPEGHQAEGLVCPAQTGATAACATCGLCWNPSAAEKRIVFIGHGKRVAHSTRTPIVSAAKVTAPHVRLDPRPAPSAVALMLLRVDDIFADLASAHSNLLGLFGRAFGESSPAATSGRGAPAPRRPGSIGALQDGIGDLEWAAREVARLAARLREIA